MSTATKEDKVDEARDALVGDIEQLKSAGKEALAKGESKLPWVIGGAVGLLLAVISVAAIRPKPRSVFSPRRPSIPGKLLRTAALSAAGIVARRYVQRVVDRALPEPQPEAVESGRMEPATTAPAT